MSERTALMDCCLHNQFHSVCSIGSDAWSQRNCSGRISEIFEMKLESWILPGTFELKPDPLSGVHLLFRFQGLHQTKQSAGVARIIPQTLAENSFCFIGVPTAIGPRRATHEWGNTREAVRHRPGRPELSRTSSRFRQPVWDRP